jgi:hypothetical protein
MMNFAESAYLMSPDECLREAGRQFAMAEALRNDPLTVFYERGGWFLLLVRAELAAGAAKGT